jgi:hypothetical protein
MNQRETLEKFFQELQKKDCKYATIKKLLTITQQEESKFVGRKNVEGHINGVHSLLNACEKVEFKEKYSTNKLLKTFKCTFFGKKKVRMECTVLKEIGVRKPHNDGIWGVNIESFKLIK